MSSPRRERQASNTLVLLIVLTLLTAPILLCTWLVVSALAGRSTIWRRILPMWAVLCGSIIGITVALWSAWGAATSVWTLDWASAMAHYALLTSSSFLLVPACVVLRRRQLASELRKGRTPPHRAEAIRQAILTSARDDAVARTTRRIMPSRSRHGHPVIGTTADPVDHRTYRDRFMIPNSSGYTHATDGDLAVLPLNPKSPSHHLVIGATGSGKTTLLVNMTRAALQESFRVAVIDFKGADEEAKRFISAARASGATQGTKMWPGDPLDLWRGSPQAVADRVMGFLPPPAGGGSEYYRARLQRAINAVVVRTSAPPPRSADELIARVRSLPAYAEDEEDRAVLTANEAGKPACVAIAEALGSYLEPLRRKGAESVSSGFSWSDTWDLAVIRIDATSEPQIRLGAAVLHDFDAWTRSADRASDPRSLMLIVDEAGALSRIHGAPALTNLVARARSARVSVVIAAQTLTSLGDDGEELMQTGPVRWLGSTPSPESMAMAAGTRRVIETGHQDDDAGLTGTRALREQVAFSVDPDEVRRLPTFFWVVSSHGQATRIYSPPRPENDAAPPRGEREQRH